MNTIKLLEQNIKRRKYLSQLAVQNNKLVKYHIKKQYIAITPIIEKSHHGIPTKITHEILSNVCYSNYPPHFCD